MTATTDANVQRKRRRATRRLEYIGRGSGVESEGASPWHWYSVQCRHHTVYRGGQGEMEKQIASHRQTTSSNNTIKQRHLLAHHHPGYTVRCLHCTLYHGDAPSLSTPLPLPMYTSCRVTLRCLRRRLASMVLLATVGPLCSSPLLDPCIFRFCLPCPY
jgi:hypothetical protein